MREIYHRAASGFGYAPLRLMTMRLLLRPASCRESGGYRWTHQDLRGASRFLFGESEDDDFVGARARIIVHGA